MLRPVLILLSFLALAACAKKAPVPDPVAPGDHGGHPHTAPHGGTLIELGEHAYNVEFVRDSATGKIIAYILDGHAENFVRIKAPSFTINFTLGADTRELSLRAAANSATGETVGDTSQFEAQADWLRSATGFEAVIPALEIRGTRFENIAVRLPSNG